jgi:cell division septum initiation protein DivIVA
MNGNSSDKSAVSFRGALNGYNKEDVNNYIEEMNIKFSETETDYKKTILLNKKQIDEINMRLNEAKEKLNELISMREKNNSLQKALDAAESDLNSIQKKYNESDAVIGALNDKLDQLTSENGALSDRFNKLTAERDTMTEKVIQIACERDEINSELQSALAHNAAEAPAVLNEPELKTYETVSSSENEKARMYDKISRQVGSMLIDAREIADNIVNEANTRAEKIVISAENKAKDICSDADMKLNRTIIYIKQTLKRMTSDCMSEYIGHINNSRAALDKLLGETSADADTVYSRFDKIINKAINDLNNGIDEISCDFNSDSDSKKE